MAYRQGTWAHDYEYFKKCTVYNNVIVWVKDNKIIQINQTNATTLSAVNNRIDDLRRDYGSYNIRQASTHVISKEMYNTAVNAINNNMNPGTIAELAKGSSPVTALQNKNVFIVWNKSQAQFIRATETEAEALTVAKDYATKNTNQAFLVCRPDSIAYQPVSITVDKVQIDG